MSEEILHEIRRCLINGAFGDPSSMAALREAMDRAYAAGAEAQREKDDKELRQIYCCKGAEFSRPTSEKAWKEIARLIDVSQAYERRVRELEREALVRNAQVEGYQSKWDERERQLAEAREALRRIEQSEGDGIDCRIIAEQALKALEDKV